MSNERITLFGRIWRAAGLGLLLILCLPAHAVVMDFGSLQFESTGQSMWGSGAAFRKSDSVFLGSEWSNKTATIGGIAGSEDTVVFPAIGAVAVPVYEPRIFVPTPTWSNPFKGYYTGCGCWKDVTIKPATPAITADTRTGAQLNLHTSGKVGLEFAYAIDSGSVDTTAKFRPTADLPTEVQASQFFNLNTSSTLEDGTIATQSPKVEASMSAILKLSGSMDATACALTFGCAESGSAALPTVNLDQRILSIDPNSLKVLDGIGPGGQPFAEVPLLNQSLTLEGGATVAPPTVGFKLTGPYGVTIASSLPPTPAVTASVAEMTVFVPDISTSGNGSSAPIKSNGRDDLLSLQVDLDGAATLMGGLPPVGLNIDLIDTPVFKLGASLDLIDVDAGPVLGLTQNFQFVPTLMAMLNFSAPVQIAGMADPQTDWSGEWSELPDIAISETTTVTPTFWITAALTNTMGLDLGLVGTLDLLKLGATASVGGLDVLNFDPITLNNLLGIDDKLFETDKLVFSIYDDTFALGGFDPLLTAPFTLTVADASTGNGEGGDRGSVPEPASIWLCALGLLGILLAGGNRHRSRSAADCLFASVA